MIFCPPSTAHSLQLYHNFIPSSLAYIKNPSLGFFPEFFLFKLCLDLLTESTMDLIWKYDNSDSLGKLNVENMLLVFVVRILFWEIMMGN
jgi:hypothetical protein